MLMIDKNTGEKVTSDIFLKGMLECGGYSTEALQIMFDFYNSMKPVVYTPTPLSEWERLTRHWEDKEERENFLKSIVSEEEIPQEDWYFEPEDLARYWLEFDSPEEYLKWDNGFLINPVGLNFNKPQPKRMRKKMIKKLLKRLLHAIGYCDHLKSNDHILVLMSM